MTTILKRTILSIALTVACAAASAGPVILGGDDLTDHGSRSASGANLNGWLYIEKAVGSILSGVTRAGTLTTDIVALGSAAAGFSSNNAGGAIGSAANVLGRTVTYIDGADAINAFFVSLAAGIINPGMLWMAGQGAANDLDFDEGQALTANAAAINLFGASGGGIMAHGSGTVAYGWLSALLPGITEVDACNENGATLTAAGIAAFPGLGNSNINASAGPCHSTFTGNLGGLQTLALDGNGRNYIIGGGGGTIIQCGQLGQPPCPPTGVPEPGSLPLVLLAAMGLALPQFRRLRGRKASA